MNCQENFMQAAKSQFLYYKSVGDKTFAQLSDDDLFWQPDEESNSIAIIVNHLWGNMLSRWTDFLTSDGEKPWRNRDMEFENVIQNRRQLLEKWEEGWQCLFQALDSVHHDNFDTKIYIRNQAHSIIDAVTRQLCHYAYHIGQIAYIGKMAAGAQWQSLTIPKGKSKAFNAEKFGKGKHGGHFSDDVR